MNLAITTSFVQDQRHVSKSERFVPVQPSQISDVLANHGLRLNHLKTGKARINERAHHQTTIARYVADDSQDIVKAIGQGSTLDLLVKAPHLTGCVEFRLGFFRGSCANQWNAGKLMARVKVRHTGDCLDEIDRAIPALIEQRAEMIDMIRRMQEHQVSAPELAGLARNVANIRLEGVENINQVRLTDLVQPRRLEDRQTDLFSVANVLQENALRYGIRYGINSHDKRGRETVRRMHTRPVIETTGRAVDMTGSIWEAAAELLK